MSVTDRWRRTPGGSERLTRLGYRRRFSGVSYGPLGHRLLVFAGLGLARLWSQFVIQSWRFSSSAKPPVEHTFEDAREPDAERVSNPEVSIARLDGDPAVEQVLLGFAFNSNLVDGRVRASWPCSSTRFCIWVIASMTSRVDGASRLRALCSARRVLALLVGHPWS